MSIKRDFGSPVEGPGSPGQPWLPVTFVARVESWDTKGWTALEWGTGWSTLWLARRMQSVVTIDHDPHWTARIKEAAADEGLDNITFLTFPKDGTGWEPADIEGYVGCAAEEAQKVGGAFDFVLVDGVVRDRCAVAVFPHARHVLAYDNGSRSADSFRASMLKAGWVLRVEQWDTAHKTHDQSDTWYWSHPSFAAGYRGLPPSPHLSW